ncbi:MULTISPECIES: hypothetical protein [Paenibacillus]|uniref:Pycsar effector protein domain-containing protein n=1 Tax=Paenibacillus albilobatus TaxID=2716884 RepID=A0A920C928_9BACL|nr:MULTISPECIES: hypothetical protein [Paenibacillus]GIO30776.1 hypothetical protein J2TS6_19170 [Paenibacillus albilobatus]
MNKPLIPKRELDPESCDAILDTAKTIYNEEYDRFKQVETKTGITLGFVGVLFGVFLTYATSIKIPTGQIAHAIYSYIFQIVIAILLTLSAVRFINAIKVGTFEQVDINNIVDSDFAKETPARVKIDLAATYQESINSNSERVDRKNKNYSAGLGLMLWGFILFVIYIIIEEIIKNV